MAAATGILSGVQTIGTAAAQYSAAGAQDAAAAFNQKLAALQVADATARGEQQAQRLAMQARQIAGTQRTQLAASGVDLTSGSAADVQADTAKWAAVDAETLKNDAARNAWGISTQSLLDTNAMRQRADAQRGAAFDTLLTGAGKQYGFYNEWQRNRQPTGAKPAPPVSRWGLAGAPDAVKFPSF